MAMPFATAAAPEAALSVLQMGVAVQKPCSVLTSRGSGFASLAAASPSSVTSGARSALNSAPKVSCAVQQAVASHMPSLLRV